MRGQAGVATYRISGFLTFWVDGAYGGLDRSRYPDANDTPQELLNWWQAYGQTQFAARQNAINHSLNGIVRVGGSRGATRWTTGRPTTSSSSPPSSTRT